MSTTALDAPALSARGRAASVALFGAVNLFVRGGLAVLGIIGAHDLGWSPALTALLVAYATLAMRFGRIAVAPLLGRGSVRTVTMTSMAAVGAGFLLLAASPTPGAAWVALTLLGVGYGAVVLSIKVALVNDRPREVFRGLGLLATALNVGAALGPLLSGVLQAALGGRPNFLVLGCGSLACAALAGLLPGGSARSEVRLDRASLKLLIDRRVLALVALLAVAFCFYAQLYATFPLLLHDRTGSDGLLGAVFALNAVVVIALQLPVTALADRSEAVRRYGSGAGLAIFALSFLVLALWDSLGGVLAATVLASVAECLLLPLIEAELAERLGPRALTAAFTLSAVGMGLGESIGSYAGVRFTLAPGSSAVTFLLVLALASALAGLCDGALAHRRGAPTKQN
ncbi:MFS transporter [Streptomyces sp. NPDC054956]